MAPSIVQTSLASGPSGSFSANVTAGNAIVLCIAAYSTAGATVSGCTFNSLADNFASLGANATVNDTSGNPGTLCTFWVDPNCAGGAKSYAVAMSAGTCYFVYALEVSGLGSSPTLDAFKSVISKAGTTTWTSGATGTPTAASELALGMTAHGEFIPTTETLTGPASPWVNSSSVNTGTTGYSALAGYEVLSSASPVTYAGSSGTSSDYYTAIAITIKPSASSTPQSSADAATGSEAQSLTGHSSSADTATGTDGQSVAGNARPVASDAATGTEAQSLTGHSSASDAAAGTEAQGYAPSYSRAAADTATGTDAVAGVVKNQALGSADTAAGSEGQSVVSTASGTDYTQSGLQTAGESLWEVFVYEGPAAADGYGTLLAQLPGWSALSFAPLGDAVGAGQISVPLESPAFWQQGYTPETTPVLAKETLWQIRQDGGKVFEFLAQSVDRTTVASDETQTVTVSGPGTAQCLNWFMAMPFGWQPTDGGFIGVTGAIQDRFDIQNADGAFQLDTALWNLSTPGACSIPDSTATYTQATQPTGSIQVGARWFDTSSTPVSEYVWDGSYWVPTSGSTGTGSNYGGYSGGGSVQVELSPAGAYLGGGAFSFTNSSFSASVTPAQPSNPSAPPLGNDPCNGSDFTQLLIRPESGHGYVLIGLGYDLFYCEYQDARGNLSTHSIGPGRVGGTGAYNSSWAQYWRISSDLMANGDTLFRFWTSGDGASWVMQWSFLASKSVGWDTALTEVFMGGEYDTTGAAFAQFSSLNGEIQAGADSGPIYISTPAMGVMYDQMVRAAARGTDPFMAPTFSATSDSDGNPWADTWSMQVPVGTDGLTMMQNYAGAVNGHWYMRPGYQLDCHLSPGTQLQNEIVFHEGEITQYGRTQARDQVYNVASTVDGAGMIWTQADPASIVKWGQRETWVASGGTIDAQSAVNAAAAAVDQWADESDARILQIPPNQPGKTVFKDFGVFDWIGVERSDFTGIDAMQVIGISVAIDQDGIETHELVLLTYRQVLAQWFQYLLAKFGGQAASTLGALTPGSRVGSAFTLAVGPNLAISPAQLGGAGSSKGIAPSVALSATPEVASLSDPANQVTSGAPANPGQPVPSSQVIPGSLLQDGTVAQSALSFTLDTGQTVTFSDTAPSNPKSGDLWYDEANGNQPYVYSGGTWVLQQFGAQAVSFTADAIGGITVYVQATAPTGTINERSLWYDTSNGYKLNVYSSGAWTAYQFGTNAIAAGSVTAAIIAAGAVTTTNLAAGAVTAAKIAANTITASQIAANTITAAQLASGIVYAGIVDSTTISAATISGGTITGSTFKGTDWLENVNGQFFYSGTPASGNLVMSFAPAATTDPSGNSVDAGFTIFGSGGNTLRAYVSGSQAVIAFPSGAASEAVSASQAMTTYNAGLANEYMEYRLTGPESSYDSLGVTIVLDSSSKDGSGIYTGYLNAGSGNAANWSNALFHVSHQLFVGNASGSAAVEVAGNTHLGGTLQVDSTTTLGGYTIDSSKITEGYPSTAPSTYTQSYEQGLANTIYQIMLALGH